MISVSIIMPVFNAANFIHDSIESVIYQTCRDWELLIINDGSTDDTERICKDFCKNDSRIHLISQNNQRQAKARNRGIASSKGDFLAFIDSDDLWTSDKLSKQLEIMNNFSDVSCVFTGGTIINKTKGNVVGSWKEFKDGFISSNKMLSCLLDENVILNSSVLVRKRCVLEADLFCEDINLQNAEDYDLWLKIAEKGGNFFSINDPLTFYRKHPNQSTSTDGYASKQVIEVLSNRSYNFEPLEYLRKKSIEKYFFLAITKDKNLTKTQFSKLIFHYTRIQSNNNQYKFYNLLLSLLPISIFRYILIKLRKY